MDVKILFLYKMALFTQLYMALNGELQIVLFSERLDKSIYCFYKKMVSLIGIHHLEHNSLSFQIMCLKIYNVKANGT